jgi:hypothetical protein
VTATDHDAADALASGLTLCVLIAQQLEMAEDDLLEVTRQAWAVVAGAVDQAVDDHVWPVQGHA